MSAARTSESNPRQLLEIGIAGRSWATVDAGRDTFSGGDSLYGLAAARG